MYRIKVKTNKKKQPNDVFCSYMHFWVTAKYCDLCKKEHNGCIMEKVN
jgi:hypothetical protein